MSSPFQEKFKEEAQEVLEALENDLVTLETNVTDAELLNKIFRGMHTLKGSGAMFGFTHLAEFAHELETLFDLVRNGALTITPEIISVSLEACDYLKILRDDPENKNPDSKREKLLLDAIHAHLPAFKKPVAPVLKPVAKKEKKDDKQACLFDG